MKATITTFITLLSTCLITHALLIPPAGRDLEAATIHFRHDAVTGLRIQDGTAGQALFQDAQNKKKHNKRVPVTLGVMSKCPDAEICESVFDKTLANVADLVDLQMAYIGNLNDTMHPYGVECKHGPSECDGNVQQLCVASHVSSTRDWWNFIQCQNFQNLNKVGDISLAKQCAMVIKMDWDEDFSGCYTGSEGRKLLQESVKTAKAMNITKSCSVFINNRLTCIHDGVWKDCPNGHQASDFERIIKDEFDSINGLA